MLPGVAPVPVGHRKDHQVHMVMLKDHRAQAVLRKDHQVQVVLLRKDHHPQVPHKGLRGKRKFPTPS